MLNVEGISKVYRSGDRELHVLQQISFEIPERQICAIVGPSGSGKTTLLGLCAGLDAPTSGDISINGRSLVGLGEDGLAALRNELVGFVFQSFQLVPTLTAIENVMVPLELRGERGVAGQARILLERVGLGERLHHYPAQLSGGEQQRVAIARAFINRPVLLFADEPTGNLDFETSESIVELLFELNRDAGTTLVLVTHDLELAARTHRIIRLGGGRILSDTLTTIDDGHAGDDADSGGVEVSGQSTTVVNHVEASAPNPTVVNHVEASAPNPTVVPHAELPSKTPIDGSTAGVSSEETSDAKSAETASDGSAHEHPNKSASAKTKTTPEEAPALS
jgi:putative ABC transport system ATP-binding protein